MGGRFSNHSYVALLRGDNTGRPTYSLYSMTLFRAIDLHDRDVAQSFERVSIELSTRYGYWLCVLDGSKHKCEDKIYNFRMPSFPRQIRLLRINTAKITNGSFQNHRFEKLYVFRF